MSVSVFKVFLFIKYYSLKYFPGIPNISVAFPKNSAYCIVRDFERKSRPKVHLDAPHVINV